MAIIKNQKLQTTKNHQNLTLFLSFNKVVWLSVNKNGAEISSVPMMRSFKSLSSRSLFGQSAVQELGSTFVQGSAGLSNS